MDQINIAPELRDYVFTLEHPNCIYNNVLAISNYLFLRKDADQHTNVMAEYDLDFVLPSARYAHLIDAELENKGLQWRIHSCHTVSSKETIRIILRKVSLVDLTAERISFNDYERNLYPLMKRFSQQYCQGGPIMGSSNLAVFRLPEHKGYYYLFTRIFDMWEYSDAHPDVGWRPLEESEVRDASD